MKRDEKGLWWNIIGVQHHEIILCLSPGMEQPHWITFLERNLNHWNHSGPPQRVGKNHGSEHMLRIGPPYANDIGEPGRSITAQAINLKCIGHCHPILGHFSCLTLASPMNAFQVLRPRWSILPAALSVISVRGVLQGMTLLDALRVHRMHARTCFKKNLASNVHSTAHIVI